MLAPVAPGCEPIEMPSDHMAVLIGRGTSGITDPEISRHHVRIQRKGAQLFVKQLGMNRCFVKRHDDGKEFKLGKGENLCDVDAMLEVDDVIYLKPPGRPDGRPRLGYRVVHHRPTEDPTDASSSQSTQSVIDALEEDEDVAANERAHEFKRRRLEADAQMAQHRDMAEARAAELQEEVRHLTVQLEKSNAERDKFAALSAKVEQEAREQLEELQEALAPSMPGTFTQVVGEVTSGLAQDPMEREKALILKACLAMERQLDHHFAPHPDLPPFYARKTLADKLKALHRHCGLGDELFQLCNQIRDWRNASVHVSERSTLSDTSRGELVGFVRQMGRKLNQLPQPTSPTAVVAARAGASNDAPARTGRSTYHPRQNLMCPFEERDAAKQRGARWDPLSKVWYVPAGTDPFLFRRWF